jgi:hypothetical protein
MHTYSSVALNLVHVGGAEGRDEMAFNRVESDTDWKHGEGTFCAIIFFFLFYLDVFYCSLPSASFFLIFIIQFISSCMDIYIYIYI